MNGNELYKAIRETDEIYLEQYDASVSSQIPHRRNTHTAKWILLAACFALFVIAGTIMRDYIEPEVSTPGTETTSELESNSDDFASHAGDGDSSSMLYSTDTVPDELLVTSDLTDHVFGISGIITDEYSEANLTEEKKNERVLALERLMDLTGDTDYSVEFGIDDAFPVVKTDDVEITSFTSYFGIETACLVCLTEDATDDEIISVIRDNLYLYSLLKYIGLQENNLYVYRETTPFYGENDNNGTPTAIMTTYKICNYSDIPQQLSFNLNSNYIKFWSKASFIDNSISYSSVYGYYYTQTGLVAEIHDYISYSNAIALVKKRDIAISDITACEIIYIPLDAENTFEPCYCFYCKTDSKDINIVVPLVNDGSVLLYR